MNINRREFFKNLGSKAAGIAAATIIPAIAHTVNITEELKKLSHDLTEKLAVTTEKLNHQLTDMNERLDLSALAMTHQQAQLHLIFILLLILFLLDGGMTA